jgi:hypothetical protein
VKLKAHGIVPAEAGATTDLWVFEGTDGRDYAYTGTMSAATMYAWDVTDPTNPVITDSVKVDGRRQNDVKINADATLAIITSEGASNRRNGFTILDISDAAHPTIITHFTEGLTGGVHNVWIEGDIVYAVHNGTNAVHIVDISDPANPANVGRWQVENSARSLHDIMVLDGLAYLSYWDDGLVVLDVGAGIKGGTPIEPQFVSQYKYRTQHGAESYGNTHHAIRYKNYVFLGDEIFGCSECVNGPRGHVHVVDVTDIESPEEVGTYWVPEAGVHNLWAEDDKLYVAYYQAGLRVVDISGELRGDLYRQGREIGWYMTEDAEGPNPNKTDAWGPQPYKGNIRYLSWSHGTPGWRCHGCHGAGRRWTSEWFHSHGGVLCVAGSAARPGMRRAGSQHAGGDSRGRPLRPELPALGRCGQRAPVRRLEGNEVRRDQMGAGAGRFPFAARDPGLGRVRGGA